MLRRLLGGDVQPALRPLLLTVGPAQAAHFAFFALFPIWAVKEAGIGAASVGTAFAASAALAAFASYEGGRLSDRIGRRRTIVGALGVQAAAALVIALAPASATIAVVSLTTASAAAAARWAAQQAFVADAVPSGERDEAFAALRIVVNVGGTFGPAVAAALVAVGWRPAFLAIGALAATAVAPAVRLPSSASNTVLRARESAARRGSAASNTVSRAIGWRLFVRDRPFQLLFLAGTLGWAVYYAWEILLPVSLTAGHGVAPSVWGGLFALNAVAVTLFQLRVTRWTMRIEPRTKIGAGLLLMAGSFLLLPLDTSLPTLVLVAIVFVAGEMLWAPASQALRAELAPPHLRGAYLGALAASTFVANGLTPALGFRLGEAAGETATWVALLGASATAAALYALVCRGRPADATESAREPAVAA